MGLRFWLIFFALIVLSFSYATELSATENLNSLPPAVEVFFITDRAPVHTEAGTLSYGSERSRSLAFGSVTVWGQDAEASTLSVPNELGWFPEAPYHVKNVNGIIQRDPSVTAEHTRNFAILKRELASRVQQAKRHEAVIFIHGYHNTFDDAIRSAAQICNDLGPADFLCVAVTWPAGGSKGLLFGYNVDRESGEFAVADVRKAIRAVGKTPGLSKLHLIAHSRGADVMSAALQQLSVESYASQSDFPLRLKLNNIVLAAPDLDLDVAFSRLLSVISDPETNHGPAPNYKASFNSGKMHFTIYASQKDKALETSKVLFGSEMRLGLMDSQADGKSLELAAQAAGVAEFVSVEDSGGFIGHSYFLSSPEVRGDIAELIRNDKKPGDDGRPLFEVQAPFWVLPKRSQ